MKRAKHLPLGIDDVSNLSHPGRMSFGEKAVPKKQATCNAEDGFIGYGAMRERDQSHNSDYPPMVHQHDSEMEYD